MGVITSDIEVESIFTYRNYECIVIFNHYTGCRCGYVGLPKNDYFYGKECYELSVHGGITYAENTLIGNDDTKWWIGFDCAHLPMDSPDFPKLVKLFGETVANQKRLGFDFTNSKVWTIEDVTDELKKLVTELIRANISKESLNDE